MPSTLRTMPGDGRAINRFDLYQGLTKPMNQLTMGAKRRNCAGFVPMATTRGGNDMPAVKGSDSKRDVTVSLSATIIERLDADRGEGESRSAQVERLLDLSLEAYANVRNEEARP